MGDGGSQLNMPQSLSANLRKNNLYATLLADDTLMLHPFILTACTLPVLHRPKYLGTKKAIPFRLEGSVVYGFGFFDLSIGPRTNFLWGRNPHTDGIKYNRVFWLIEI
jgi:hypothetical protein